MYITFKINNILRSNQCIDSIIFIPCHNLFLNDTFFKFCSFKVRKDRFNFVFPKNKTKNIRKLCYEKDLLYVHLDISLVQSQNTFQMKMSVCRNFMAGVSNLKLIINLCFWNSSLIF